MLADTDKVEMGKPLKGSEYAGEFHRCQECGQGYWCNVHAREPMIECPHCEHRQSRG
jgi:rubrerythrin